MTIGASVTFIDGDGVGVSVGGAVVTGFLVVGSGVFCVGFGVGVPDPDSDSDSDSDSEPELGGSVGGSVVVGSGVVELDPDPLGSSDGRHRVVSGGQTPEERA